MNPSTASSLERPAMLSWIYAITSLGLGFVPVVILFTSLSAPNSQRPFRAQPTNLSYEWMTFAVGLSIVVASVFANNQFRKGSAARLSALDSIRIAWPLTHSILNFLIGCYGAGILWLILGFFPSIISAVKIMREPQQKPSVVSTPSCGPCPNCNCTGNALRAVLIIFGVGLVSAPIPLPWSGPPEPFIRWHDYSVDGELLWRGTFCNFAIHNWLAATDPTGRHRPYVVFMAAQGLIHATVMLVDNRSAASLGHPNGNAEHAIEISGFYLLGLLLSALLVVTSARETSGGGDMPTSHEPEGIPELKVVVTSAMDGRGSDSDAVVAAGPGRGLETSS